MAIIGPHQPSCPVYDSVKRCGMTVCLLSCVVTSLGACDVIYRLTERDFPIELLVTPVWMGVLMLLFGAVIWAEAGKMRLHHAEARCFWLLPLVGVLASGVTSALVVTSLSNLAYQRGFHDNDNDDEQSRELSTVEPNVGATASSSGDVTSQIARRQIIDAILLTSSIAQTIILSHLTLVTFHLGNPRGGAMYAVTSCGVTGRDGVGLSAVGTAPSNGGGVSAGEGRGTVGQISVAEFFENSWQINNGGGGLNDDETKRRRNDRHHRPTIYDDFPDFDLFRNNIERD